MSNLIEQWNEHIVRGNQLSRELENIEALIEKSKGEDICFTAKPSGSNYITVLSPEKMQELRESAVLAIMQVRDEKIAELEKLMGIRKGPTITMEIGKETVESGKTELIAENLKSVKAILKEEVEPIETDPSLDKYPAKKKNKAPESMNEADIRRMYIKEGRDRKYIADYYGVSEGKVNNYLYLHDIKRKKASKPDKQPEEKEYP